jgi:hypothetical protein
MRIFPQSFHSRPFVQIRGFEIPGAWGVGKSEKNEKWPPKSYPSIASVPRGSRISV